MALLGEDIWFEDELDEFCLHLSLSNCINMDMGVIVGDLFVALPFK